MVGEKKENTFILRLCRNNKNVLRKGISARHDEKRLYDFNFKVAGFLPARRLPCICAMLVRVSVRPCVLENPCL